METEAIDNQANLVNYDNENENEIEDLGYESKEYTEDAHEDDENNHSNGYAKRGITRLCKFRREYGKPGGVKLSVTFDALNRISGKHRALFLSFLGDMVREHIGLQILSWKKVGPEARNKLWDEITRYFDVDLTVRKLVMNRLGQLLRNFRRKLRQTYILPNQDTPSKLNEVPAKKKLRNMIKEGTLQVDQGTDAMTLVLGKEKGGYARGIVNLMLRDCEHERERLLIKSGVSDEIHQINFAGADEEGGTNVLGVDKNDGSIRKDAKMGVVEDISLKTMEHSPMPVLLTLLSDDDSVVARHSIVAGCWPCRSCVIMYTILVFMDVKIFHRHGFVERWLKEMWSWMLKFKDAISRIALEARSVGPRLLAIKFLETCMLLFMPDNDFRGHIAEVPKSSQVFNISWLAGGHPVLDSIALQSEANRSFMILLDLLRLASSHPGPITISAVNR
ncbi:ribonuclease H-like domain-containing protein [Tanacetum coccineum]